MSFLYYNDEAKEEANFYDHYYYESKSVYFQLSDVCLEPGYMY